MNRRNFLKKLSAFSFLPLVNPTLHDVLENELATVDEPSSTVDDLMNFQNYHTLVATGETLCVGGDYQGGKYYVMDDCGNHYRFNPDTGEYDPL